MKLERRHLIIVIVILVLVVLWRITSSLTSRAAPAVQSQMPLISSANPQSAKAAAQPSTPAPAPGNDLTAIPAPPGVDLAAAPIFSGDPFLGPGESRAVQVAQTTEPQPVGPDPVLRSILYSATRRMALVGNRIVKVGDAVSTGTIVEITRDAIVIRTPTGEMRRVQVSRGPRLQDLVR